MTEEEAQCDARGARELGVFHNSLILVLACTVILVMLMFYLGVQAGRRCRPADQKDGAGPRGGPARGG